MKIKGYLFCLAILITACHSNTTSATSKDKAVSTIVIQPFTGIETLEVDYVFTELKKVYPHSALRQPIDLPSAAWNPERKRYRADSLINYLRSICPPGAVILGLTNKDISTTRGKVPDWGVMGLGFCPGNACIASGFRLSADKRQVQLFKAGVHELGHTQGLPHCAVATCYMRDAEGKNVTAAEKSFCVNCASHLQARGWLLE